MALPNSLLLTYQIEFETTQITIEEICEKYDVTTKDLKGYTKWKKRKEPEENELEAELVDTQKSNELPETLNNSSQSIVPVNIDSKQLTPRNKDNCPIPRTREELLDDVEEFKQLAITHAIKFMKNDAEFAEVKEFKDMVAIVDSIEKSYKDTKENTGTTINMVVQNLVQKFQDDC